MTPSTSSMREAATNAVDVLCAGRIMVDVLFTKLARLPHIGEEIPVSHFAVDVGGGAGITAIALGRLGCTVGVAGVIGADVLGRFIQETLSVNGVNQELLTINENQPTIVSVECSFPNDRATITANPLYRKGVMMDEAGTRLRVARHLHVAGDVSKATRLIAWANSIGLTVSVDTDLREEHNWNFIRQEGRDVDFVLSNNHEMPDYDGDLDALSKMVGGLLRRYCVIKCGPNGAVASDGRVVLRSPSFANKVVDTTGAGDAFNAGFIFGFLRGYDIERNLIIGNALGSCNTTTLGGAKGLPRYDELQKFLSSRNQPVL